MSSYQNVDLYVLDEHTKRPMSGVLVRVLSLDGTTIYTEAQTGDDGHVAFLLWTQAYTVRLYRFQTRFQRMPVGIEVLEGPGGTPQQNTFNVYGSEMTIPLANDPYLCRASGYFRDITGAPQPNLDIIFIGEFAPILLQGAGVLSERRAVRTDEHGYACIDLIRCAKYSVTVEGYEDQVRSCSVPDSSSVSLPALLFPTVDSVSFDLPSPWTLSVGSELSLKPTVVTSSGIVTEGSDCLNVHWTLSDDSVASLTIQPDRLILKGLKPGSTKLVAKRWDNTVVSIPYTSEISGSGQSLTVL